MADFPGNEQTPARRPLHGVAAVSTGDVGVCVQIELQVAVQHLCTSGDLRAG
ncbi:hypothetical protein D9M71_755870 [compost metagenome]